MKRTVLLAILTASALLLGGCLPADVDVLGVGPVENTAECEDNRSAERDFVPFLI